MTPTEFDAELDDISADSICLKDTIAVLQNTAYPLSTEFMSALCVIRDFADNLSEHCKKISNEFLKIIENERAASPESAKKGEPHDKCNGEN